MEEKVYEKINEARTAIGDINIDLIRMFDSKNGDEMRGWYCEALQDLWKLFNAVNSRLLDEGKG